MLYIGDLVNTHGIKGEVKVISNFKYKEEVFKKGSIIYINDKKYIINTYRKHQKFDLLTFESYENINDVLDLKGNKIYINKEDYTFSGILNEDLYGKKVYDKDKYIGTLKEIIDNKNQELLVIENNGKEYLVPYVDEFVKEIKEDIKLDLIKGLIDED
ncbi:MAG: 16S rRNA processing protein RimM [Bacilli bacterium]|nr:16S rRNA processing protein RimM [Bacilli bacterium]